MKTCTLKKRDDFVLISNKGIKAASKGVVLQALKHESTDDVINVGFTVTKKVGNAVARNRIKRRLRAVVRNIFKEKADPTYRYVLIGRQATLYRDFKSLEKDLKYTLHTTGTYKQKS